MSEESIPLLILDLQKESNVPSCALRQDEHQGFGSRTPSDTSESSRRRGPVDPRRPHQRIGDGRDPDKVNYGYHPIIDFFSPYRLQSQSRK